MDPQCRINVCGYAWSGENAGKRDTGALISVRRVLPGSQNVGLFGMRITVNIDDESLRLIKKYMKARGVRQGEALSELVRQGLNASPPTRWVNGLLVFDPKKESPRVTTKKVRGLL